MKKLSLIAISTLTLAGCKPDVDVKISTEDLVEVAMNEASKMISFDARIENKYTTVDDEKKAEVEVDVSYGGTGFEIEIEGELELVSTGSSNKAPWYFSVIDAGAGEYYVSQRQSIIWDAFANDLSEVSFMAKPDKFLPVNLKIKNDGGELLVGGAILDGEFLSGFARVALDGSRVNLNFYGDHWEKAPASFLFINGN